MHPDTSENAISFRSHGGWKAEWFKFTGEQDTRKEEVFASVIGICCMNQMSHLWVQGGCYTCCKAML